MSTISQEDYNKALTIIAKRNQYNKQYYQKRKQQQENTEVKKTGRKPIEEITPESITHTTKIQTEMPETKTRADSRTTEGSYKQVV